MISLGSEFCHMTCGGDEVSFQSSFIYVVFLTGGFNFTSKVVK